MTSYTVREGFADLRDFTTNLPRTFDHCGVVIHNSRNVIKKIDTGGRLYVVKNFKGMYFFNRLAYSLFRPSKAVRSYNYSALLNQKGISTPPHVAWIDCYTLGFLTRSYFVSVYSPNETLGQYIRHSINGTESLLLRQLAAFILKLHRLGIYHEDLSLGNILVNKTNNGYDFALVDLNRIKFGRITYHKGLRNFGTLRMDPVERNSLIREYAKLSRQDPEKSIQAFAKYEKRKSFLRRLRRKIRGYTVTPLENLLGHSHA